MGEKSDIEWTDSTWNVITGCEVLSPGCRLCYAMKLAGTRMKNHPSRKGLTKPSKNGPVWNGEIRFNEDWLADPLRWKKGRPIFVVAHGDLFHKAVTEEMIDKVFAVMALCEQHKFQVLTKRTSPLLRYLTSIENGDGPRLEGWRDALIEGMAQQIYAERTGQDPSMWLAVNLPLSNVYLGFSAENQEWFDKRWADMAEVAKMGWKVWCSAEPLLGPIDARAALANGLLGIVAGGLSKPHGTPKHVKVDPCRVEWVRHLRDQCAEAGAAFHFKQWGEWMPCPYGDPHVASDKERCVDGVWYLRVGKKRSGALLDGREHLEFPA